MTVIDADAHVIETEQTWDYLEPAEQKYRPLPLPPGSGVRAWLIDGRLAGLRQQPLTEGDLAKRSQMIGRNVATPKESREMHDVELRLQEMDRLGIDVEVLHNTVFIMPITDKPAVEVAICRAWNRWVADIWRQGKGRLRWSCVPPTLSMDDALAEIRFGKEHGAVAVLMRPVEGNRTLTDPYFYPVYEEAVRLDMPIVIHIANGNPYLCDLFGGRNDGGGALSQFRGPTVIACHQVMMSRLPELFPALRWAFVEAGAQWLPWVISDAKRRFQADGREWPEEGFDAFNIWVTCQSDNDLEFIVKHAGEDRLLIGTDYGHVDTASEVDAITVLRHTSGLEPQVIQKFVDANARAVFGL